ncbi:hypothetical protein [Salininema proteolyticum]|uniref:GAF domain-containing protein n=1 Tax=Salininema proteolyticum TaxID=1607685 RepID=A0ABV8TSW0_9ACTN
MVFRRNKLDPAQLAEFEEILIGLDKELFEALAAERTPVLAESMLVSEVLPVENLDVLSSGQIVQRLVSHIASFGDTGALLALSALSTTRFRGLNNAASRAASELRANGVETPEWAEELTEKVRSIETIYSHADDSNQTWILAIFQRGERQDAFFLTLDEDFCGEVLDIVPLDAENIPEVAAQMRAGTFLEGDVKVVTENFPRGRAAFYLTSALETSMDHRAGILADPRLTDEERFQEAMESSLIALLAFRLSRADLLSTDGSHGAHVLSDRPEDCPLNR